jgi:hypothetical protein
MTRRVAGLLLPLALLASASCGKKGPILPPLVRVPQAVEDLSLSRVGDRLVLSWTDPGAYIDGNPLEGLSEVEVWVIEQPATEGAPAQKPAPADIEKQGRLMIKVPVSDQASPSEAARPARRESVSLEPDPEAMARNVLFISVRARDGKRRPSEFSDPAILEPAKALPPPRGLKAAVFEDHIELAWAPPADLQAAGSPKIDGYNIYRSEGEGPPARLNPAPLTALEFQDADFSFGKAYVYFVRTAAPKAPVVIESEGSDPVKVEPVDVFAPAPPRGLTTISGEGFIALSWEPAAEPDLAGYKVWRRAGGETAFALLKELSPAESSFSDTEIENDRQYVYAITAIDRTGNESGRSAEAAGLARRPRA